MRLSSGKFKYLERVKALVSEGVIPSYVILKELGPEREISERFILRSALKNEGEKQQLQSGKSLSLGGIDSWQKLASAWERIQKQPDLEEVILQKEISWQTHVTLIYEKDFFFAELKSPNQSAEFIYWTPLGQSLSPVTARLKEFLHKILPLLNEDTFWLLEAGIAEEDIFLFQLHPVSEGIVIHLFSGDLAPQIISSRLRFSRNQGLWNLIKTEWKARKFRNSMKDQVFHPSAIFMNWEFLFHYFRLFCMIHRQRPDASSFGRFLSESYQDNWFASMVKKHLELANFFRKEETYDPLKLGFEGSGPVFIGKGLHRGVVGEDVLVCHEISLEIIYGKHPYKIILSREVGLLSHPVLASVEKGIQLVLGVRTLPDAGERIYLDFERKLLTVE